MRFHCNVCKQDFTILSQDKERKIAFSMFVVDNQTCPNCGAMNRTKKFAPLKKTRSRWQPKRRSMDMDEYALPDIVLHPDCQSRLCGSISIGKVTVICDGCPSSFNCLTGNVDEGFTSATQEDYKDKTNAINAAKIEEAEKRLAEIKKRDEAEALIKLRDELGRRGFYYFATYGQMFARFNGTIWKLSKEDEKAILDNTWHTPKTIVMKNTFANRGLDLDSARKLLSQLLPLDKEQGV